MHAGPNCTSQESAGEKPPEISSHPAYCMFGSHKYEQRSRVVHQKDEECSPRIPAGQAVCRRHFSWYEILLKDSGRVDRFK